LPADGRRKKIIAAVAAAAAAPNGGSDYFYTLTTAVTKLRVGLDPSLLQPGAVALEVYDRGDRHKLRGSNNGVTAELTVAVVGTVRDAATNLVDRVNDLAADLTLALWRAQAAGGTCTAIALDGFDPPHYDYQREFAVLTARVVCQYDYDPGVDR
jgi:hypothetical protein